MIFAVFSSMGGPGRPRSHFSTPPQLTITYMYIYVCARACKHASPRDAVFALPGGRGVLRPPLSQTLSIGEQYPNISKDMKSFFLNDMEKRVHYEKKRPRFCG